MPRPDQPVHAQPPQVAACAGCPRRRRPAPASKRRARRCPHAHRAEVRVGVARWRRPRRSSGARGSPSCERRPIRQRPAVGTQRAQRRRRPPAGRSAAAARGAPARSSCTSRIASASSPNPAENVNRRPFSRPSPIGRATPGRDRLRQPLGRAQHVLRPAQLAGEHRRGAGRQQAQRDAGRQAVHDLVVGAVAAHGDDHVGARARRQLRGMSGRPVRRHLDLARPGRARRPPGRPARRPVPDDRGLTIRRTRMGRIPYRHVAGIPADDDRRRRSLRRAGRARATWRCVWNGADGFEERRRIAFDHGIALAVILAVTLWLGRVARWLERTDVLADRRRDRHLRLDRGAARPGLGVARRHERRAAGDGGARRGAGASSRCSRCSARGSTDASHRTLTGSTARQFGGRRTRPMNRSLLRTGGLIVATALVSGGTAYAVSSNQSPDQDDRSTGVRARGSEHLAAAVHRTLGERDLPAQRAGRRRRALHRDDHPAESLRVLPSSSSRRHSAPAS